MGVTPVNLGEEGWGLEGERVSPTQVEGIVENIADGALAEDEGHR